MSEHKKLTREEQASREIGVTDSTRGINLFLTGVFVLLMTAVPAWQAVSEWRDIRSGATTGRRYPQCFDIVRLLPTRAEVGAVARSGGAGNAFEQLRQINNRVLRDIGRYESGLKDNSKLVKRLIPPAQAVITGFLQGGNEDAYCGRNGWLFYRSDIDYVMGPGFLDPKIMAGRAAGGNELKAPPQPDPVSGIVHFRDQLKNRGIELLVVPVPVKPCIHPEMFSKRYAGRALPVQNPSFAEFMERLDRAGVHVLDLAPAMMEASRQKPGALYFAGDTHWTPRTMEKAAGAIVDKVRGLADMLKAEDYSLRVAAISVTNAGDVAVMLKLPADHKFARPEKATVRQVMQGDGLWQSRPDADVLLLGDSFANIYSLAGMGWGEAAGLTEHISYALNRPVDRIIRNDAGSYATREMLATDMARGKDRLKGKKVVIWEFAVRELSFGDWKSIELPGGVPEQNVLPDQGAQTGEWIVVSCEAVDVSNKPRTDAVYSEFIMKIYVSDMKTVNGKQFASGDGVVHVLAMSKRKILPVASVETGAKLNLRIKPWDLVERKMGSLKSGTLGDINLEIEKTLYFGELER